MSQSARPTATLEDFWAIPEARRFHEFFAGELVEKATPTGEHGGAQASVVSAIVPTFQRKSSDGGVGGWWIATEVEVLFQSGDLVRPDVLGWRRDTCPTRPTGIPVRVRPDWICEVVSPSNATNDTVKKLRLYHRVGVPHYWILDPGEATLTVMRWSPDGFVTLLRAERHEIVRPEPFAAVEFAVGTLFGEDPPEA